METIEDMVAEATRRGISYGKLQELIYRTECEKRRQKETAARKDKKQEAIDNGSDP